MPSEFKIVRRVEFAETDMAGKMHFSNYFKYMAAAESAFFDSLDESLFQDKIEFVHSWPRVSASCEYSAPLVYGDVVEVHLRVAEIMEKGVKYTFHFIKIDGDERIDVANAKMTALFGILDRKTGQLRVHAIPEPLLDKLNAASTNLSPEK